MQQPDSGAAYAQHVLGLDAAVRGSEAVVIITFGGQYRGDFFQFIEHRDGIDIAAVENHLHTVEGISELLREGSGVVRNVGI